jgi:hypothetical protein
MTHPPKKPKAKAARRKRLVEFFDPALISTPSKHYPNQFRFMNDFVFGQDDRMADVRFQKILPGVHVTIFFKLRFNSFYKQLDKC